uniref:Uncharacterized protein n=1 Tax=Catagonus wagneri TaxID=51154 RepID=A0A8C3VYD7_9CETA
MQGSLWELLRRRTWARGTTSISLAVPRPWVGFWNEPEPRRHATELPGAPPAPLSSPRPFWGNGDEKVLLRAL